MAKNGAHLPQFYMVFKDSATARAGAETTARTSVAATGRAETAAHRKTAASLVLWRSCATTDPKPQKEK